MKNTILISFIILHFCIVPKTSDGAELYFLEGSRVLLYKIINWWYYSPPGEGEQLCGDSLKYLNTGNAKVHYYGKKVQVKITISGGFASLLSLSNEYSLTIEGIHREISETLGNREADLVFTLFGAVQGLQNGKIALGDAEDMLGKCQTAGGTNAYQQKTYFTVGRSVDGPVLMRFEIHPSSG